MITLKPTDKHNRTLLAEGLKDPQMDSLEITVGYTGNSAAFKAVPLDNEVIPWLLALSQQQTTIKSTLASLKKAARKTPTGREIPEKEYQALLKLARLPHKK